MDAHTEQRGVVPKRRLPSGFHTPSHRLSCRVEAARLITLDHLGDVGSRILAID
jgi:hypothetical protein